MTVPTWDSIADWYAERIGTGSAMHEFARELLLTCLPDGLDGVRILDVGCGEGTITRAVAGSPRSNHTVPNCRPY